MSDKLLDTICILSQPYEHILLQILHLCATRELCALAATSKYIREYVKEFDWMIQIIYMDTPIDHTYSRDYVYKCDLFPSVYTLEIDIFPATQVIAPRGIIHEIRMHDDVTGIILADNENLDYSDYLTKNAVTYIGAIGVIKFSRQVRVPNIVGGLYAWLSYNASKYVYHGIFGKTIVFISGTTIHRFRALYTRMDIVYVWPFQCQTIEYLKLICPAPYHGTAVCEIYEFILAQITRSHYVYINADAKLISNISTNSPQFDVIETQCERTDRSGRTSLCRCVIIYDNNKLYLLSHGRVINLHGAVHSSDEYIKLLHDQLDRALIM